ncbi:MAG TPA: TRAP transporter large permease [Reyranella sp.]|nr:TRAP transporter large permease [Reyranella sp.]
MLLLIVAAIFLVLIVFSMPIVFALGVAGVAGLWIGGYDMQMLSASMVSGSQSWVLLAIPAFVFAGGLMEKCGMSSALVEFARALVGWVKGGLGMSVIVVAYFFSDICGSKMAEVSALGSTLMPPLTKAGYKPADSASLIAAGTAMGMLVPPAIFMIVIAQVTNTSAVALFLAGFIPAATIMICLMALVYYRARKFDWPVDNKPSLTFLMAAARRAAVPLVIPFVILGGFFLGIFTATEAGAVVAGYAFVVAKFYYRNVTYRQMGKLAYESAILTAAVVFLLAVASIFQYLMGVSGVPKLLADVLGPLKGTPWLFLMVTALITMMFGMVLEGLPAAVVLIPVVFPIAEAMGIDPIHFNIVQTAAVGIGLFLPPMGVGLLMALKFANLTVGQHWRTYMPYVGALMLGLVLIILFPQLSLFLPQSAGLIK